MSDSRREHKRADFDQQATRLALMSALAAVIALLAMIRLYTNLFYFQSLSLAPHSPGAHMLGAWAIGLPVLGGLIVSLIACSDLVETLLTHPHEKELRERPRHLAWWRSRR